MDNALRRAVWTGRAAAVAGLAMVGCLVLFAARWLEVSSNRDCPRPDYTVVSSEAIETRSVPPRVVCRYSYERGATGTPLHPPRVKDFDTLPPALGAVVLGTATTVLARSEGRHLSRLAAPAT